MNPKVGTVYLVGAGPGDPGLITVRGLSLLRRADVIVYDRLVARELLTEARTGAEQVDAGKSRGDAELSQGEIGSLLVERAKRGLNVVRLKGGDPFVFGRGYEELSTCRAAGVPCVVISGVTSAVAVPSAAGIPITHRKLVRSVAIVTGSVASESESPPLDFAALSRIDTVIVLMGREKFGEIIEALITGGRVPSTPVAVIQSGTTATQRTVRGTLSTIARLVEEAKLTPPVVTVVGEVAALASDEDVCRSGDNQLGEVAKVSPERAIDEPVVRPLHRRRIVLTRARSQSAALTRILEREGAIVISCPLLRITFPPLSGADLATLHRPESFDRIVFTSVNGVRGFFRALRAEGRDIRSVGSSRIAAVGTVTARALRRRGLIVDLIPPRKDSAGLVNTLLERGRGSAEHSTAQGAGGTLIVRGDLGPSAIQAALASVGERVESLTVYTNEPCDPPADAVAEVARGVDAVLFYSPSAVRRFLSIGVDAHGATIGCIGPTTADAARAAGFKVGVVAARPSDSAMRDALRAHFAIRC